MRTKSEKHGSQRMVGLVLIVAFTLTACSAFGTPSITTPSDTSAHNLDATFTVGTSEQPGLLAVSAWFKYQGIFVRFAHGEHITCDGIALRFEANTFTAYVPDLPNNQNLVCTYGDAHSTSTTVAVPLVAKPVILTPTPGTTVARTKNFAVAYVPQSVQQVQLEALTSRAIDCVAQQGNGSITCDVTSIPPGTGTLTLDMQTDGTLANTGFRSTTITCDALTRVAITLT